MAKAINKFCCRRPGSRRPSEGTSTGGLDSAGRAPRFSDVSPSGWLRKAGVGESPTIGTHSTAGLASARPQRRWRSASVACWVRPESDTGGKGCAGGGEAVPARGQSECSGHVSHVNARVGHLVWALVLLRRRCLCGRLGRTRAWA
jgi:hypothetical protein